MNWFDSSQFLYVLCYLAKFDMLSGLVYGGSGGDPFDEVDVIGTYGIFTPKLIEIRKGQWVDSIQVTYQTSNELPCQAPKRGGNHEQQGTLQLDADQTIVRVTGVHGKYVDALQFTTNKGRMSPYCGGNGGKTFSESHPGYVLSYISGRSGKYLDQIQFHWVREEVKYIMPSIVYD
jgi:hypothetical protein